MPDHPTQDRPRHGHDDARDWDAFYLGADEPAADEQIDDEPHEHEPHEHEPHEHEPPEHEPREHGPCDDGEGHDARGERGSGPIWSGRPNATLVAEVADLPPGRALDVGCGEGADAIWLAQQGWQVTAVDPSRVALGRAEAAAQAAGVEVTWLASGLLEMPEVPGAFDLVTGHYAVLRRSADDAAVRALVDAVAPGGTLLVVHHEMDATHAAERGLDPADYVMPVDVANHLDGQGHLDDTWRIETHESRPRTHPASGAPHHVADLVLRARRSGGRRPRGSSA